LIAVTGWGQEEDKRKAQSAGFDRHLTKPVDPDEIEQLLDAFLSAAPAAQGTARAPAANEDLAQPPEKIDLPPAQ
jgi:DNA-binding response OmpR family regulator